MVTPVTRFIEALLCGESPCMFVLSAPRLSQQSKGNLGGLVSPNCPYRVSPVID